MKSSLNLNTAAQYICLATLALSLYACKNKSTEATAAETTETREPVVISQTETKEVSVVKQTDATGKVTATITTSTKEGNELRTEDRIIRGTAEEINAKINALKTKK